MGEDLRYAYWVDLVAHLVTEANGPFPHQRLLQELSNTFSSNVSWNWQEANGSFSFDMSHPIPGWPTRTELAIWAEISMTVHPLLWWYRTSMDMRALSIDRVPRSLVPQSGYEITRSLTAPVGVNRQLAIPYAAASTGYRSFVLAQGGPDFGEEDMALARRLQPLLAVVDRQSQILASAPKAPAGAGLTAREAAVLELLSEGATAARIGHVLGISPRTVHSHLTNLYRKLGVCDRVQAVMVAHQLQRTHTNGRGSLTATQPRPTQVVFAAEPSAKG
jgi:DNA-binding CsgD family transcriptional regulator